MCGKMINCESAGREPALLDIQPHLDKFFSCKVFYCRERLARKKTEKIPDRSRKLKNFGREQRTESTGQEQKAEKRQAGAED